MSTSATTIHEALDRDGLLDASHGPGCYALRLETPPNGNAAVRDAWLDVFDVAPEQHTVAKLANCRTLLYVGSSGNVYNRLLDHFDTDKRKASIMRVFSPVEVIGVWPCDDPDEHEFNLAIEESRGDGTVAWCDGTLYS